MMMQVKHKLQIRRYESSEAAHWNNLIEKSVNGTFLFRREFMDYHSDRFEDFSYLLWRGSELIAVFVAGRAGFRGRLSTMRHRCATALPSQSDHPKGCPHQPLNRH